MKNPKYKSNITGHAVVFGGSGGIGSEVVRALVDAGVEAVSFTYARGEERAKELALELEGKIGKVYFGRVDPSDEHSVRTFLDEAVQTNGIEITSAVYAIGVSPNRPFLEQRLETDGSGVDDLGWRDVYEINVFGCMISMREVANRMKDHDVTGAIVFITSTNGINSHSQISAHYDTSKAAQSHLMRIMAEEYAPYGIRINGIAPGWINTDMNKTLPKQEREKEIKRIWSGKFAEPHEIAMFIAFILGTGGSYAYGQDFMLDGGYR
jgi:3-oxoacyl-[acyl-carrier protein] reductase